MSEILQDEPNSATAAPERSGAQVEHSLKFDAVTRPEPCAVGNLSVDRFTFAQAMTWLTAAIMNHRSDRPIFIAGTNAFVSVLAEQNPEFRDAMHSATVNFADGESIVLASRLMKKPIPARIPMGELMVALCAFAANQQLRIYLLGGLPGAAESAAKKLKSLYPGLETAGTCCPPNGFELDIAKSAIVREEILASRPDILFVALGCPKQEIWIHQNAGYLSARAIMPVGAAFDTLAGLRVRAPKIAQQTGTEWLFRLMMEPRRLWKRYLIGNFQFAALVLRQVMSR
jgi:N-acetylglucosaminyldiphosphoundecaprenol N-acetyl-beta-D-mannosaminyltransferase